MSLLTRAVYANYTRGVSIIHRCSQSGLRVQATNLRQIHSDALFEAAKEGDVKALEAVIDKEGGQVVDVKDSRGWTPLMYTASLGKVDAFKYLMQKGSDTKAKSRSGFTALELALLGKHSGIASLFPESDRQQCLRPSIFFTGSPLNRTACRRNDDAWLLPTMQKKGTKYMLLHHCKPIVITDDTSRKKSKKKLLTVDIMQCYQMIKDLRQNLVFLGLGESVSPSDPTDSRAYFAIDISDEDLKTIEEAYPGAHPLALFPDGLRLSPEDAALSGHARSLLNWHFRYKYCPTCGSETFLTESGYKRICTDQTCLSHTGVYNTNHPRTDPSVIVAVVSARTDECLLARKRSFPPGMYTCLAGFVEPGESVEMACIREIEEEVGIRAHDVEYIASQPWPMPNALMLGCFAYASSDSKLKVDESELEHASWFSRSDVVRMLLHSHQQQLFAPPQQAIAHQLLKQWLLRSA